MPQIQFDAETATVERRYAVETNQVSRDDKRQANLAWDCAGHESNANDKAADRKAPRLLFNVARLVSKRLLTVLLLASKLRWPLFQQPFVVRAPLWNRQSPPSLA
jgi:hypothetical protein